MKKLLTELCDLCGKLSDSFWRTDFERVRESVSSSPVQMTKSTIPGRSMSNPDGLRVFQLSSVTSGLNGDCGLPARRFFDAHSRSGIMKSRPCRHTSHLIRSAGRTLQENSQP